MVRVSVQETLLQRYVLTGRQSTQSFNLFKLIVVVLFQATKAIIDREAPGLGIAMITRSLNVTPMAMLSRCVRTASAQSIHSVIFCNGTMLSID